MDKRSTGFNTYPYYKHIFNEDLPNDINELVKDVASETILTVLCWINTAITKNTNPVYILFNLLSRQVNPSKEYYLQILQELTHETMEKAVVNIFQHAIIIEFINHELINYRETGTKPFDINPIQELNIFKAYIVIGAQVVAKQGLNIRKSVVPDVYKDLSYQYIAWPISIKQLGVISFSSYAYSQIKSRIFFENILKDYPTYLKTYLDQIGYSTIGHYIFDLMGLDKMLYNRAEIEGIDKIPHLVGVREEVKLFDTLSLDRKQYAQDKKQQEDYKGLKERPLLPVQVNGRKAYLVLSWKFLQERLDITQLFHFFNQSGIGEIFKGSKGISLFKTRYYSSKIMENILFKKTIQFLVKNRYDCIFFDESLDENATQIDGRPDCYIRRNNEIFLFEFKDAWLPTSLTIDPDFEDIKSDIDKKFVNKKGLDQLMNSVKKINLSSFPFDLLNTYKGKVIKKNKINVYLVIVYTHKMYTLEGVNDYLKKEFESKIDSLKDEVGVNLRNVNPPVMISLDFLINFCDYVIDYSDGLYGLIKDYLRYLNQEKETVDFSESMHPVEMLKILNRQDKLMQSFDGRYYSTANQYVDSKRGKLLRGKFVNFMFPKMIDGF